MLPSCHSEFRIRAVGTVGLEVETPALHNRVSDSELYACPAAVMKKRREGQYFQVTASDQGSFCLRVMDGL